MTDRNASETMNGRPEPHGHQASIAAVTFHGRVFHYERGDGFAHVVGDTLFYEVPPGKPLVLTTKDAAGGGRGFWKFFLDAECDGPVPTFEIWSFDAEGRPVSSTAPFKAGRLRMAVDDPAFPGHSACMRLIGQGALRCSSLRLLPPPVDSASIARPAGNILYDLVWPDFEAARRAGAEIPPPPLSSPLN